MQIPARERRVRRAPLARHKRISLYIQPPMVKRPAMVVALTSPVRSTSSAGPKPKKKCSTGWNMTGANRLSARLLLLSSDVTLAPVVGSLMSVLTLLLANEKPALGQNEKRSE